MGKGIQGIPEKEGYRRGRGRREGKSKKKKSGTNTRCPARTPPHLDQHLISIDTTPRSTPHLGPNSAQAATSRSSGGNLAIRSSAALPTPTQLSAPAGMTGGQRPESQPAMRSHKYNQTTTTCRLRRTNSATTHHYNILDSKHPQTTLAT